MFGTVECVLQTAACAFCTSAGLKLGWSGSNHDHFVDEFELCIDPADGKISHRPGNVAVDKYLYNGTGVRRRNPRYKLYTPGNLLCRVVEIWFAEFAECYETFLGTSAEYSQITLGYDLDMHVQQHIDDKCNVQPYMDDKFNDNILEHDGIGRMLISINLRNDAKEIMELDT
eukprot:Lankesteria_metandrocarpae@DN4669_c0_g1_i2.p1